MRRCCICKVEKELNEFNKCKSSKDGRQNKCKICLKQWYQLNKEKKKQYQKEYWHLNRENIKNYQQDYSQLNREKMRDKGNQYYRRNPEKHKARSMLNYAVRSGKIHKPLYCSCCDSDKHLEAHHTDYSKPLEVTWLCRTCHRELHSKIRDQSGIDS